MESPDAFMMTREIATGNIRCGAQPTATRLRPECLAV